MERERPEYLPPLKPQRNGFPWLVVIGISLGAAMICGAGIYLRTVVAWEANRTGHHRPTQTPGQQQPLTAEQQRLIEETAAARAEYQRRHETERNTWKCVNGTPFRPVEGGGWENVVGERC